MRDAVKLCGCGGRELLDGEELCPSCKRTHNTVGWRLGVVKAKMGAAGGVAGKASVSLLGKAVSGVITAADRFEGTAVPLVRAGLESVKEQAEPIVEAALDRVRVRGEKAVRAAIPIAEKAIDRAKAYIDKDGR